MASSKTCSRSLLISLSLFLGSLRTSDNPYNNDNDNDNDNDDNVLPLADRPLFIGTTFSLHASHVGGNDDDSIY